tara:strand:+ start:23223 stop:23456 length:234 start_codon:yes stop_codon:yes gene_type:complete
VEGAHDTKFKVGDLVRGFYDFEITYCFDESDPMRLFYGVIMAHGESNIFFPYGNYFYQVLCTDGTIRFFTEWELKKV